MSTLPASGATELTSGQAVPETSVNEIGRFLDAGFNRIVIEDRDLTAPPGTCGDGAAYLIATGATGTWAGKAGRIAFAVGTNASNGWLYLPAFTAGTKEGFVLYIRDEDIEVIFNGSGAWVAYTLPYHGCLVTKSADETTANYTTAKRMTFDSESYDTDSIHTLSATVTITIASPGVVTWTAHGFTAGTPIVLSTTGALPTGLTAGTTYYIVTPLTNTFQLSATPGGAAINTSGTQSGTHTATNNSCLQVPTGVTKVRLSYSVLLSNVTANEVVQTQVLKNGLSAYTGNPATGDSNASTSPRWTATSPVLSVTAGDRFELELATSADNSITVASGYTWFAMEVAA